MDRKMKFILGGCIASLSLFAGLYLNWGHSDQWNMLMANVEALAQGEGAGGECPNGGYWATGNRDEDKDTYWEKVDIKTGISLGLFKDKQGEAEAGITWRQVMTVAYFCDNSSEAPCLVCNRYKL